MFGLNPVATGMLIGSVIPGFGTIVGGAIGAMYDSAQGAKRDALDAAKGLRQEATKNQNALVEDAYNKKKAARGLSDAVANPAAKGLGSEEVLQLVNPQQNTTSLLG